MALHRILMKAVSEKSGATAVEYGFIMALIVLVMLVAFWGLASETLSKWTYVVTETTNAVNAIR